MYKKCEDILTHLQNEGKIKISDYQFPPKQELKLKLKDILEDQVSEEYFVTKKVKIHYTNGKNQCKQIAQMYGTEKEPNPQAGRIYDIEGISPTLDSCGGGNRMPKVAAAMRGRYLNGKTEQQIEVSVREYANTITTVQKDSLVASEMVIRKLTSKECFRLQGFDDEDYEKVSKINSSTQLYKQAGNSICVNVLEAILKNLLLHETDVSNSENKEEKMKNKISELIEEISNLELDEKVKVLNELKKELKRISPFTKEPVDCVQWIKCSEVVANDYNPNTVAPPEMELLHTSIKEDGYTQPIVVWWNGEHYEVVDGFHRNRIGKEYADINERINGYLPVVVINDEVTDKGQRIASTIRHNRARGKHQVQAMSDIVLDLRKRNWSNEKISKKLGMDADEVLRLSQITGLAEMFSDKEFTEAWECDIEEVEVIDDTIIS